MSVEALARVGITPDSVTAMLSGNGRAWVAEEDGRIVAFSMADACEATVFAMFVQPGHEGKGLGRRLMTEAEQWLFSQNCDEIWLLTAGRARGFYQHLGWRNEGIQEDGQTRYTKRRPRHEAQLDDGRIGRVEITEKQRAIEALRALPEHATIEDAIERLCFIAKIEEGLRQSDARQLVSHDEVKKQFLS